MRDRLRGRKSVYWSSHTYIHTYLHPLHTLTHPHTPPHTPTHTPTHTWLEVVSVAGIDVVTRSCWIVLCTHRSQNGVQLVKQLNTYTLWVEISWNLEDIYTWNTSKFYDQLGQLFSEYTQHVPEESNGCTIVYTLYTIAYSDVSNVVPLTGVKDLFIGSWGARRTGGTIRTRIALISIKHQS